MKKLLEFVEFIEFIEQKKYNLVIPECFYRESGECSNEGTLRNS